MVSKRGANSNDAIPQRLRAIRKATKFETAKDFAEDLLQVSSKRYGNIEAGKYALSKEIALRIVEKVPGMTLDWLFRDSRDGLSPSLHQRLEVAAEQVAEDHRIKLESSRRRASQARRRSPARPRDV
jgi:DNA-binding XRE family transcriptional regulator